MIQLHLAVLILVGLVAGFAWLRGYDRGVKDTERRWADTVGRGDNRRHD